jgi:hypothetical protein
VTRHPALTVQQGSPIGLPYGGEELVKGVISVYADLLPFKNSGLDFLSDSLN